MSEIKDPALPGVPLSGAAASEITRRDFLNEITWGALGIAGAGSVAVTYQFFSPNVLFEPPTSFRAGNPDLCPCLSVTFLQHQRVFLGRMPDSISAVFTVCTQIGCVTQCMPGAEMNACPCRGSKFKSDGTKVEGPAPRPLPHFAISLTSDGELLVDKLQEIKSEQVLKV